MVILCTLTITVFETISRIANIAKAEVAPNGVVAVRIMVAHGKIELALIDVYIDNNIMYMSNNTWLYGYHHK